MPEILTESFCERCGTRYTFESAAPRTARLKGFRVLSKGLKNYVLSDDTSMDEAMAAARSETDREATSHQLDAFHKTFNFCMSCRQYTCANCWNEAEGRCLSCAPHLGREILPAPFPDLDAHGGAPANGIEATNGVATPAAADAAMAAMAWPTSDLMRDPDDGLAAEADLEPLEPIDAAARLAALSGSTVDEAAAADAAAAASEAARAEPEIAADHEIAATLEIGAAPDSSAVDDAATPSGVGAIDETDVEGRANAAAGQTSDLFHRFRPGQNLDAEIEAYEREQQAAAALAAGAVAASPPHPGPVVDEPTSEPVAAEPVAEPVAAEAGAPITMAPEPAVEPPAPEPVAEAPAAEAPAPEPIAASAARDDLVEQPTWRIVAPDETDAPAVAASPAAPASEPQWPASPEWPSQRSAGGLPFLGRPADASGGIEALWAESAREVATGPGQAAKAQAGVQPCVSCGLSLSSTARFCRRCGTRQG